MDNRYQAYKQVEVNTTNRGKIVVMLYAGAITFLNKTKMFMEKKDYQNKSKFLVKSLDIIEELNIALDLEKGGDIAKNLRSIYLFLNRYLHQANLENNPKKIDQAINILDTLKSAFEEILKNPALMGVEEVTKKEQVESCIRKVV